jgi:hypothetical protein
MAKKGKKEKQENRVTYVKTASLNDLVRNIAGSRAYSMALKSGSSYRLLCEGEHLGECRLVYYFDSSKIARYLIYSADEEGNEKVEMVDDVTERNDHYKSQRIPIVEISKDPYSPLEKDDLKNVTLIGTKDMDSLVRAIVSDMEEDERPKLYSFMAGKERIFGSFTLTKHDTFVYAKASQKAQFSSISYDSVSDTIEFTNSFAGTSKLHIRIINLGEQPPFFKV